MSHNDEFGFTFLNKGGNVVKTELKDVWLGSLLGISTSLL